MGTHPIRVTDASRVFDGPAGPVTAFAGLDLSVRDGEAHALLGPSGCGKTTLLRVLAGLDELTSGDLEVPRHADGRVAAGIVLQQPHLLPWLSVRENTALGLRYRANRGVAPTEVDRALDVLGLSGLADALPAELSGGQAQRVAIARTIVTSPAVLLLDEPFAALDPLTRHALQRWLADLRGVLGLTIVLVTHDVDEALYLGDRTSLLHSRGVVARWDTTGLADDEPRRRRVRSEVLDAYAHDPAAAIPGAAAVRASATA